MLRQELGVDLNSVQFISTNKIPQDNITITKQSQQLLDSFNQLLNESNVDGEMLEYLKNVKQHIDNIRNLSEKQQVYFQTLLYKIFKKLKNIYIKSQCIECLTNSLTYDCCKELAFQLYNDILQNPFQIELTQMFQKQIIEYPQVQEEILYQIEYPYKYECLWKSYNGLQYSNSQPQLLQLSDNTIVYLQDQSFTKHDQKFTAQFIYFNNEIFKNQLVYLEQNKIRINKKLYSIEQCWCYQILDKKNETDQITKLGYNLQQFGFTQQLLKILDYQLDTSKINIKILIYDCMLFSKFDQQWNYKILNKEWLLSLIQLCYDRPEDSNQLFHKVMLHNLKSLNLKNINAQLLDLLLTRLFWYYDAKGLDLKYKFVGYQQQKEIVKPQPKKQQKAKPSGVGYGGSDGQFQLSTTTKQQIYAFDDEKIFNEASEIRWDIMAEIFRLISNQQLKNYQDFIEDSALIPILKSLINQLGKNSQLEQKKESFLSIFKILNILLDEELIHLYIIKVYGDQTLFEQLQKTQVEISLSISNIKDEQIKQLFSQYQECYNTIEQYLDKNDYITITYESQEQTTSVPEDLYPIVMKPLILTTSDVVKQSGWYKQMGSYYETLSNVPQSAKMNRLIKELSDISEHLPLSVTNSIFLRYDKDRMDAMQTLIFGSSGTPYAHGAFLYNMLFCDDYPERPPKCLLETTGHGKVRFNPNLYNCGKVCLSLLGTWGDNWIPNKSTLLQILVSIQAMVMSEYVYYNEPGWESSMGTTEGEMNNRGYCNIVKLANIRYAMIEQLQKPPAGLEEVIQKSFYLRKEIINKEIEQWIAEADLPVSYHCTQNQSIAQPFISEPAKFKTILKSEFETLKKELEKLKVSISSNPSSQTGNKVIRTTGRRSLWQIQKDRKIAFEKSQQELKSLLNTQLEKVDVQEDIAEHRVFDSNSADVQNLMSRYIGVMGLDSVNKQSQASVLLLGLNALGIETAKNLVLSGLKRLTIIDSKYGDNFGQFFVQNEESRLKQSLHHLQCLNPYVSIDYSDDILKSIESQQYQLICLCEIQSLDSIIQITQLCRKLKIGIIVADLQSVIGRVFVDLGEQFIVQDKDGEQAIEILIDNITEQGVLSVKQKHHLDNGMEIQLKEVIGQGEGQDLNSKFTIQLINQHEIQLLNFKGYQKYVQNGRAKQIKQQVIIDFKPLDQIINEPIYDTNFDFNLNIEKLNTINSQLNWYIQYRQKYGEVSTYEDIEKLEFMDQWLAKSILGQFPPQAAFLGGLIAQEALKAITHKYMPLRQSYFHLCEEILDLTNIKDIFNDNTKYRKLKMIIGNDLSSRIAESKLFMIGAGAIGCELLKNYAMLGLGRNGKIILTDPDIIEKSNLSRQFLFREKHIRKPKSTTAANACLQMNNDLNLIARLDRVGPQTQSIYTNEFYEYLDIVTNALDNVQARLYVDQRCVQNQRPLIESGTLGPKGHVQVIIPFLSESYGSKQDPNEENDIPYCTLKMFPEDINHCLEWARDKFEKMFNLKMQQIKQCFSFNSDVSIEMLELTLKFCNRRPRSFIDCVQFALNKFYKYFNYGIKDLIKAYPLDHIVNNKLFWSSPKRPPTPLELQLDQNQLQFIKATASLYAQANGITYKIDDNEFTQILQNLKPKPYEVNAEKLKQIQQEVQKETQTEQIQQLSQKELINQILDQFKDYFTYTTTEETINVKKIKELDFLPISIPFEKDEDDNNHINFIQSAANCRAQNYKIETIDWLQTKLKAGRIVPAMATTTSCIAGLQTIEVVKVLKKIKFDQYKNSFLNLAIPYCMQSEPGECEKSQIRENKVTFWDYLKVTYQDNTNTMAKLIDFIETKYQYQVSCIKQDAKLIYQDLMFIGKTAQEKEKYLNKPILCIIQMEDYQQYTELDVSFCDQNKQDVKGVPKCRFYLE